MIRESELPVFSFGWELEATGRAHRNVLDVVVGHDGSVDGDALEYRTRRQAVFDPERSLAALRAVTTSPGLEINASCGFHVHVGLGMKTRKLHSWAANFVTLARLVEAEAMAAVPSSRRSNSYCRSWKDYKGSVMASNYSGNKHNNPTRYCWINPVEIFRPGGIRTIEVRLMGHSKDYLYLLAWTSFCRRMAASSWALVQDPSRLDQEVTDLREILKTIKSAFVTHELTGVAKAKAVVLLAARAGFYEGFTPSLKTLSATERRMRYEMDSDLRDREEYQRQIEILREFDRTERQSLAVTHETTPIPMGTNVTALRDVDEVVRAGNIMRVSMDFPGDDRLLVQTMGYGRWYVPRNAVRLTDPQAVPVVAAVTA